MEPIELTLEKKFNIIAFKAQVEKMSLEQAQEFLIQLYEQMVVREAIYQNLLKHQWGLDSSPHFE